MKKITYPNALKINIDERRGKLLDELAESIPASRPSALLHAFDFFCRHRSLSRTTTPAAIINLEALPYD